MDKKTFASILKSIQDDINTKTSLPVSHYETDPQVGAPIGVKLQFRGLTTLGMSSSNEFTSGEFSFKIHIASEINNWDNVAEVMNGGIKVAKLIIDTKDVSDNLQNEVTYPGYKVQYKIQDNNEYQSAGRNYDKVYDMTLDIQRA